MAYGSWIGVSQTAKPIQSMHVGDLNQVARKAQAAWIGDENGLARLFYQSLIKLFSTAAFERGGNGATTGDLRAYKSGSGYAVLSFPANAAFANAQKLTLHFYLVSKISTFDTIALRSGTTKDDAYGKSTGIASPVPDFTPSSLGWQSVDLTVGLDASGGGVARAEIAANGLKIFMRSEGSSVIGGIGGENCPYVTIESAASGPEDTIGDTLTWDGDMTGRVNVEVIDGLYVVKVSDSVPQSSDFVNGCQVVDDATVMGEGIVTKDVTAEEAIASFTSDGFATLVGMRCAAIIVPYAGYTNAEMFGEVSLPEAGVYFMYMQLLENAGVYTMSFTIPGYEFKG